MDMKFGTWNVTSLRRTGALKTVARDLGKCKLDLVGVQGVRWEKGGTERAEGCTYFHRDADRHLVVAKVRERLAVSKRASQKIEMDWSNLKKLNEGDVKEQ
jgi:exonuclease III